MVKFDVVVGNPPYQEDNGSETSNYAKSIYPNFMDSAYSISYKSLLITPGRFLFNAGSHKTWNDKMLTDEHLKVVDYWSDSRHVFSNIDIKGGIAITYRDEDEKFDPIGSFIPYAEIKSTLDKVDAFGGDSMMQIVYSQSGYRLSDLVFKKYKGIKSVEDRRIDTRLESNVLTKVPELFQSSNDQNNELFVPILGAIRNKRLYKWINKSYITYPDNFEMYKVIIPSANGAGDFGERISQPLIGEPMTGHTRTFMSIGSFANKQEADNCLKYISCKFSRSLLGILKVTQNTSPANWEHVPLQDFTKDSDIDWSKSIAEIDQQLYEKYGLSEDEIEFIETHVKEMD